jgi:benzylsuccinate CoA-transferase BbsF subunit
VEIAKKLVAWADVVAENMTPGVMVRLGLGYDELRKVKPDIIMLSTANEGQTGPRAQRFGYGIQLTALCGLTNITGWPDRDPAIPFGAYSDYLSAHVGAAFLLAALDHRRRTGEGQYLDLSQNEATIQLMAPLFLDSFVNKRAANRMGNRCPYAAPHGVYPCCGDDNWCAIAVFTDDEWKAFCQVISSPEWARDPKFATLLGRIRNQEELDELVATWTVNFTAEEVMTMMQSAGVAAGVVRSMEEINQDPQLNYRNQFREIEHPAIGKHGCDAPSYILSKTPAEVRMPAPLLGQHNEYVYTKLLGISDEEFVKLLQEGVFD